MLLEKGVYPYEYIVVWEKFNKTPLPEKKIFSHLNMKDITDAGYINTKRVCKDFKIKNLTKYHDFYVQSDTLLLNHEFNNFRNMCLEIYELYPARLFDPRVSMTSSFKKTYVKLDLLTNINLLFVVKKLLEEEYCMLFMNMQKLVTNI